MEEKLKIKNEKLKMKKPEIRYLNDMRNVLYDKKWLQTAKNFEVYYMYRGVKKRGYLRYDITDITSRMLGQEFPKTKGHQHSKGCPELIIVLEGKTIFLFQKTEGKQVLDVYAISAKRGEVVIAPAEYAHITINPSKRKLKIANWIDERCKGSYEFIEKMAGACYFFTKKGWIKNKNYAKIPELRFKKPLKSIPKNLSFLLYGNS